MFGTVAKMLHNKQPISVDVYSEVRVESKGVFVGVEDTSTHAKKGPSILVVFPFCLTVQSLLES